MKVISIYELLGLIKDGKYPTIKYEDSIFKWDRYDYVNEDCELKDLIFTCNWFEPLLEIIEDEFIDIEEIKNKCERDKTLSYDESQQNIVNNFNMLSNKINDLIKNQKKIIDKLKEEGK